MEQNSSLEQNTKKTSLQETIKAYAALSLYEKNEVFKKEFKTLVLVFIGIVLQLIKQFIGYGLISFVFLSIYAVAGFEKTIIILLVGVVYYGQRIVSNAERNR